MQKDVPGSTWNHWRAPWHAWTEELLLDTFMVMKGQKGCPALCRKPVYIFGEPGLEKDELAALIHFGSGRRRQPMAHVDCAQLNVGRSDELLGTEGSPGIVRQLKGGTLLLNNVHQVCLHPLPHDELARER